MSFKKYWQESKAQINQELEKYFDQKKSEAKKIDPLAFEMINRFQKICLKGKKIRGMLLVLSYESCGGRKRLEAVKLAGAVEALQTAILVFDDVMDKDNLRRGLPTLEYQFKDYSKKKSLSVSDSWYGTSMAVNSGVLGLQMAYELVLKTNLTAKAKNQVLKRVFNDYQLLCFGQGMDLTIRPLNKTSLNDVEKIHYYKTATYTGLNPILTGADLAKEDSKTKREAMKTYGKFLSLAFQTRDDLLGVFGDSKTIGKPSGADLREGKRTYLTVHTFHSLLKKDKKAAKRFSKLLGNKDLSQANLNWLKEKIVESGAKKKSEKMVENWVGLALKSVSEITDDKRLQKVYEGLAEYIIIRDK